MSQIPSLIHLTEIDSTNNQIKRLISRKQSGEDRLSLAVLADTQTAGRGRGNNKFISEKGGLYFSWAQYFPSIPDWLSLASLIAGCALHKVLNSLIHESGVYTNSSLNLKWPNDLMFERRKLAGILTESLVKPGAGIWLICGIGVNLVNSVSGISSSKLISLIEISDRPFINEFNHPSNREKLAFQIISELINQFAVNSNEAEIRTNSLKYYRRFDFLKLFPEIELLSGSGVDQHLIKGKYSGIDNTGEILIDTGNKQESIRVGTILNYQ